MINERFQQLGDEIDKKIYNRGRNAKAYKKARDQRIEEREIAKEQNARFYELRMQITRGKELPSDDFPFSKIQETLFDYWKYLEREKSQLQENNNERFEERVKKFSEVLLGLSENSNAKVSQMALSLLSEIYFFQPEEERDIIKGKLELKSDSDDPFISGAAQKGLDKIKP